MLTERACEAKSISFWSCAFNNSRYRFHIRMPLIIYSIYSLNSNFANIGLKNKYAHKKGTIYYENSFEW